jgi:hypothetical protein
MVLLVATASLVGISSIYQPVNVETQPQQLGEGLITREQTGRALQTI